MRPGMQTSIVFRICESSFFSLPSHELSFSPNRTAETDFSPMSRDRQILGTDQGPQLFSVCSPPVQVEGFG